jgi:hypothetical protein
MDHKIPTFTPKNSALVLIDHQTGTSTVSPFEL